MKKLHKLVREPLRSVGDVLTKRLPLPDVQAESLVARLAYLERGRMKRTKSSTIYVVGFSTWKQYIRKYFPASNLVFIDKNISQKTFNAKYRWRILTDRDCQVFIWGYKAPDFLFDFIERHGVKKYLVEDGFIRSVGLGATKEPPLSLCLDSKAAYFDARQETDLENLLNTYNCTPEDLKKSKELIKTIIENKISKYNHTEHVDIETVYGVKKSKRILVIGQVEDDASIKYGCETKMDNNDLVRLAVTENPGADVFYKVHPDVLNGYRDYVSSPDSVKDICYIIDSDLHLADALDTIDHVYTMTSLSGLEALMRGIEVTTIGAPFYAGWGLTDSRQIVRRRTRNRTLEELVAISYIIYPKYFNVNTGKKVDAEHVIKSIVTSKNKKLTKDKNGIAGPLESLRSGIYQNYKGDLYQILYVARYLDKKETIVVCRHLYGNCEIIVKPEVFFKNNININGHTLPEFKLVTPLESRI